MTEYIQAHVSSRNQRDRARLRIFFVFSVYLQRGALDNRPVENQQENQQEDQLQAHQQQAPPAHDQLRRADQWMLKPQYSGAMARQHIQLRQADQWKMRAQYSGGMARQHPV